MTVESENNERAVVLSEEVDFLEALLVEEGLPPGAHTLILDRRDAVREALQTAEGGSATDEADEGYPMPDGATEYPDSDEYDEEDAVAVMEVDEDHEFQPDRGGEVCLICKQPREACEQEP